MNFNEKHAYLKAMEIELWLSKKSPRFKLVRNDQATNSKFDSRSDYNVTEPPKNDTHKNQPKAKHIEKQPPCVAEQAASTSIFIETVRPFYLSAIAVDDQSLVVTDLPTIGDHIRLTKAHIDLLSNIVKALGITMVTNPIIKYFRWPIIENKNYQNQRSAMDSLQGFLDMSFKLPDRIFCLLMGPMSAKYTLRSEKNGLELKGVHQKKDKLIAVTDSLDCLLKVPALKKEVWQDISPARHIIKTIYDKYTKKSVCTTYPKTNPT